MCEVAVLSGALALLPKGTHPGLVSCTSWSRSFTRKKDSKWLWVKTQGTFLGMVTTAAGCGSWPPNLLVNSHFTLQTIYCLMPNEAKWSVCFTHYNCTVQGLLDCRVPCCSDLCAVLLHPLVEHLYIKLHKGGVLHGQKKENTFTFSL